MTSYTEVDVVAPTVALYSTHLVSVFVLFFVGSYTVRCLELILSFCAVAVSDYYYWRLSV